MTGVSTSAGDLSGIWSLYAADGSHRTTMPVPGDVHSALEAAGIIPDPYFGENETSAQWVAHTEWVIERQFVRDDIKGDWYLDLDYIDTIATVHVNDVKVLDAENCFRRYRPNVSHALKAGTNVIRFVFPSSIEEGRRRHAALPFDVPWLEMNSPLPYGNMLRKPQCHFGWDWNIAIAPLGLYGRVALRRLETARIEHLATSQEHRPDGTVAVTVDLTLYAARADVCPVYLDFDGETVRLDCGVAPGETLVRHIFEVQEPRLWWPVGSGEQALYTLTVEAAGEICTRGIGLRTVELLTTPDEAGSRFAFRINGREIFCRGANWIPADALFSRTSLAKTEDLLRSAVEANMNMIRIWGGGFYEHDWFYEICDRLGLMIWQDFMFACNLYPSIPEFLENVAQEVEYQVKRLISHPSIVLWCGDNELVGALNWFEVSRKNRDRYLVSYDRLNRTIEMALRKAAPQAIWWPSSPASGYLDYGDAWHADGSGDMHYWSVWHENKSFDNYRTVKPRFCSEFGFQSYASLPVIRSFAGEGDLNIASPVIELHQKNKGGNERIAGTMFRYFRFPTDFAKFVYLSQVQQALAIQTAVDYWRSLKPHCMGTIFWQLNDTWPVASWASLDHGGGWKALHHAARRFFQPVHVAAIPEGAGIRFHLINDTNEAVDAAVELSLLSLSGERRALDRMAARATPSAAVEIGRVDLSALPGDTILAWSFEASNGMSGFGHQVRDTYKALDLEPSGLEQAVARQDDGSFAIDVTARGLALFVMIESETTGRFSGNLFDLAAGEGRRVLFTPACPAEPGAIPRFTLYDLYSSQSVSGQTGRSISSYP